MEFFYPSGDFPIQLKAAAFQLGAFFLQGPELFAGFPGALHLLELFVPLQILATGVVNGPFLGVQRQTARNPKVYFPLALKGGLVHQFSPFQPG